MKNYKLASISVGSIIDYEKDLNKQQLKVVKEAAGPCLVLAGAGSGKTRVLIYRLAYLLQKNVRPENIMLATFTNKAAKEMINRAELLLKSTLSKLWAGTFHHIANLILRREAPLAGYSDNFTIIDKEDSKSLIDDCLKELGFLNQDKLFPKKDIVSNILSLAANSLRKIGDIVTDYYPHLTELTENLEKVSLHYHNKKIKANLMDFDDLLLNWLKILKKDPMKDKYSQLFQYILVDEYQDTNKLQFMILKALSSFHKNILVVGDDAQSIYSFRAAEIKNILDFPEVFDGAKIFKLETNYRSTVEVLSLANQIIKNNVHQFPKTLKSIKGSGELPVLVSAKDAYQQARFVSQKILELNAEGFPLSQIAILVRSHFQGLEAEVELLKKNIPYVVRGGVKFFEQAHIKDVMAYLKITINPKDELSFKRAAALHKGIGYSYAYKIWNEFNSGKSIKEIEKVLPKKVKEGFSDFLKIFYALKDKNPQQALKEILKFYKDYCFFSFDNPEDRILDLEELIKMAADYPTLKRFIAELNAYEDFRSETIVAPAQKDDIVVLTTIHQAKGLEWGVVFLIGLSEYEFPHPKSVGNQKALEEERRLFYVAATRAKSQVFMSYPQGKYTSRNGFILTKPSRFIEELNPSSYETWHLEEENPYFE